MKYVKENGFRRKAQYGGLHWFIFVIVLIFSSITSNGQSLKLKNATIQQLVNNDSPQTFYRYFVLLGVKGNAKQLETDSLCVFNACYSLLNPDSTIITKEIIRGKKKTFLRISINSSELKKTETLLANSENDPLSGVIYYRANEKRKTLPIPKFHQLPLQTTKE